MASTYEVILLAQTNFTLNAPECIATLAGTQNAATSALTAVALDTDVFDPYNMHSTVTNNTRITPTVSGRYEIFGLAQFAANATGGREAFARLNGTTTIPLSLSDVGNAGSTFPTGVPLTGVAQFFNGTTDYVELVVNQNSGGTLNVSGSGLRVRWVRYT